MARSIAARFATVLASQTVGHLRRTLVLVGCFTIALRPAIVLAEFHSYSEDFVKHHFTTLTRSELDVSSGFLGYNEKSGRFWLEGKDGEFVLPNIQMNLGEGIGEIRLFVVCMDVDDRGAPSVADPLGLAVPPGKLYRSCYSSIDAQLFDVATYLVRLGVAYVK